MKEFKVNEFLALKLEHGNNNIYVGGEIFKQCKYLMLNTPINEPDKLNEMESVDEVADALGWTEDGQIDVKYEIYCGEEFWGYCSSLQAWYEHEYDARLLHSSLAFPLLKKLVEVGDPIAKKVFKEEIAKRFRSGYHNVVVYIIQQHFLDYFNKEELVNLIRENFPVILKSFGKIRKFGNKRPGAFTNLFNNLLKIAKENNLIKELVYSFIKVLNENPDILTRYTFSNLLEGVKENNLLKEHFFTFLEFTNKIDSYYKHDVLSDLLNVLQETGLKDEFFPIFLETIYKLPPTRINSKLLYKIKEEGLMKEYFSIFLEKMYMLDDWGKNKIFSLLIEVVKEGGLEKDFFIVLLESLEKLRNEDRYRAFYRLIDSIKNTEIFKEYNSQIETQFLVLLKDLGNLSDKDMCQASNYLFKVAKEKQWMEEHFPLLIKPYEKFTGLNQYYAFSKLFDFFNNTKLLNRYNSQLETIFATLLTNIENLPVNKRDNLFYNLLGIAKKTGWIDKYFLEFLRLPVFFYDLIVSIKGTKVLRKFFSQIEKQFLARFNSLDNLSDNSYKISTFAALAYLIVSVELLERFYAQIEARFLPLWYRLHEGCSDQILIPFLEVTEEIGLIKKHFPALVKTLGCIGKFNDYYVFPILLRVAKEEDWIEEYYIVFLESIDKMSGDYKYIAFRDLITNKNLDMLKEYYSQIEKTFLGLVETMAAGNIHSSYNYEVFSDIFEVIREINLIKKDRFLALLGHIKEIWYHHNFYDLYKIAEENKWIEDFFHVSLKTVYELYGEDRYRMFSDLINSLKKSELIIYESLITNHFLSLLDEIDYLKDPNDDYDDYGEGYSYYSDVIAVNVYAHLQYSAFNILIYSIKSTPLLELLYPQIKTQFHILLSRIDDLCDSESGMKHKFGSKYVDGCENLIEAVKGTDLENEIDFKKWKRKNSL